MATTPTDRNLIPGNGMFPIQVAIGAIPGWTTFRKFGTNEDVPGAGSEELWPPGTARVLPTSAGALSIVSSSTADDSAAVGTGCWTITVEGLDSNYAELSEVIALDGQVAVASVGTDWFRVNRAYAVTAGTGETNAGNISISIGGALQAYIEAGEGQTHQTQYTVPAEKTVIVTNFNIGIGRMAGSSDAQISSAIKLFGANAAWRFISDIYLYNGQTYNNSSSVTLIPEKTEIKQVITSSAATQVFGTWGGFLIDNNVGI
jgi:hypothetical protein